MAENSDFFFGGAAGSASIFAVCVICNENGSLRRKRAEETDCKMFVDFGRKLGKIDAGRRDCRNTKALELFAKISRSDLNHEQQ